MGTEIPKPVKVGQTISNSSVDVIFLKSGLKLGQNIFSDKLAAVVKTSNLGKIEVSDWFFVIFMMYGCSSFGARW